MKRRNREPTDSLELMLDTICNTFGGIVFLALLVCILSKNVVHNRRSQADQDETTLQSAHLSRQLRQMTEEDDRLAQAIAQQQQLLEAFAGQGRSTDDTKKLLEHIQTVQRQIEVLEQSVRSVSDKKSQIESEIARLNEQSKSLTADLAAKNASIATQNDRAVIKMRTPMARTTFKRQVPLLLSKGKIYQPISIDRNGFSDGRSAGFATALDDDELTTAELARCPGVDALQEPQATTWRRGLTRSLSGDRHYICLAVWPDSYDAFVKLRDQLIDDGYEYQLMLMEADDVITFGNSGPGQVQ